MIEFSELYRHHATDVFRFALYLSGNRSDAEDITSETFVRAFAASERIEAPTIKSYLFAIARNLFLMGVRKEWRQTGLNDRLRDAQPDAYAQAEQKEKLDAVLRKLRTLPAVDRAALLLRTLEDRSYEEIAELLKITVVAARVKVHRARAALLSVRKD